jgi:hypothetical protein
MTQRFLSLQNTSGAALQVPRPGQMCEWFLLCDRPATVFVEHPIIGPVPTCAKCAAWYERMSATGKEVGHGGKL